MKLLFTLLFSCSIIATNSQTYPSSCTPTPTLEQLYRNDAYKCAVTRLVQINSPFKDSIEVPLIYRDSIAKVFYAIQNMMPSPLKDTILNLFGFSNFSNSYSYEADSLHFVSTNSPNGGLTVKSVEMYDFTGPIPWANDWASGNYNNTAYPQVNELVNRYQLSIYSNNFTGYHYFKITSATGLNTRGLANSFNAILNSTTICTPVNYFGDGNSVSLIYEADGIKITYSNRCGDCPSGCQTGRAWTFFVSGDCTVQYLGATNLGSPLSNIPPYIYTCTRGPVLPVTFGAITGYLQGGKTAINWKVLTQVNIKQYIIERSDNGQQFYTTATVPATSTQTADYTWKDAALLNSTAWYRIKAVDLDGKVKYSSIVKISGAAKGNSFTVYPNPVASKTFTIQFGTPVAGQMQAGLYSIDGKKVWATTLSLTPQTISRTLTLPASIQPGVYSLVVNSNNALYRQTIVVNGE